MLRRRTFLSAAAAGAGSSGCAALAKWLPTVISVLGESAQVLEAIEAVADQHFRENPDEPTEKRYRQIMATARSALSLAHRLSKGADAASKQKVDKAFAEFKVAYQDLLALLGPLGVVAPAQDGDAMRAPVGDGPLLVPPPESLTL